MGAGAGRGGGGGGTVVVYVLVRPKLPPNPAFARGAHLLRYRHVVSGTTLAASGASAAAHGRRVEVSATAARAAAVRGHDKIFRSAAVAARNLASPLRPPSAAKAGLAQSSAADSGVTMAASDVAATIKAQKVVIFSTTYCPYCDAAKAAFECGTRVNVFFMI